MFNPNPPERRDKVQLITAYCYNNNFMLRDDQNKRFVLESLAFLVNSERIWLYGYVLLENQFHAMWQQRPPWDERNVRQTMLRFTARKIKYNLRATNEDGLEQFRSRLPDRKYQFWDKESVRVTISSLDAASRIMDNMHVAPVEMGLCREQQAYPYSSAWFYGGGESVAGLPVPVITHFHEAFGRHNELESPAILLAPYCLPSRGTVVERKPGQRRGKSPFG